MKKYLLAALILFFGGGAFAQSLSFKALAQLLHRNDVEQYLTGRAVGFSKADEMKGLIFFVKNKNTPNEEKIDQSKLGLGYQTQNLAYIQALIKQINYPLILKDEDKKAGTIFYQYGNTHMVIAINIQTKPDKYYSMSIVEK